MSNDDQIKHKAGDWLLKPYEEKLKNFLIPKVPLWLETYHLTYLTLLWSILVVGVFYLGIENTMYLYFIPLLVVLQYITDLLDGAVGRARDTGLVKWGYYVDHFLDFVFMSSLMFGYSIVIGFSVWLAVLYGVVCGVMISTFLLQGTGGTFRISFLKIGPTEGRLVFILFHIMSVYLGLGYLDDIAPFVSGFAVFVLVVLFFTNQHKLWKKDLDIKKEKDLSL